VLDQWVVLVNIVRDVDIALDGRRRITARCHRGATEAIMLAHGFTAELLVDLVRDGLATAARGIVCAGNRPIEVTRLTITDVGRQALAGT
jgi:hypothetical protein